MRAGFLLPLLAVSAASPPTPGGCPATITPAETLTAPDGWSSWSTRGTIDRSFTGVTFSDGDPSGRAFLAPDSLTRTKAGRVERYDLTATHGAVWLSCQYDGSTIAIARATALRGKMCTARYAGSRLAALSCR